VEPSSGLSFGLEFTGGAFDAPLVTFFSNNVELNKWIDAFQSGTVARFRRLDGNAAANVVVKEESIISPTMPSHYATVQVCTGNE